MSRPLNNAAPTEPNRDWAASEPTATTLREREMLKRHVRGLSAEGRLSAYILIALPLGVLLFSMWSNYDYVSLLWTTLPGIVMSVMGILAMLFGIWWMRKTVTIEV